MTEASTAAFTKTTDMKRVAVCRQCNWLMRLPPRSPAQAATCPRCQHAIAGPSQRDVEQPLAWSLSTLLMLALVFASNFLGFSTHGISHSMRFTDAASALFGYGYPSIAAILLATTVVLPAMFLAAIAYICVSARKNQVLPGTIPIARTVRTLQPWLMSDVFIVGVLVSLTKIVTLANIYFSLSFIAFCVYSLMLLRTTVLIDWTTLWDAIAPPSDNTHLATGTTARSQGITACRGCDTPFVASAGRRCPRCDKQQFRWLDRIDRLQLTGALLVTSAVLYIPANLYPVLITTQLGRTEPQTILAGIFHLAQAGSWPIALVILLASIVVPLSKILALGWLCLARRSTYNGQALTRTRLFRVVEKIGRWSMIDVFVVAILCALVQAGELMTIQPGPGVIAFAAVVVLTMLAAISFDTRLLWPACPHEKRENTDAL